jgi:TonB family protein
MKLIKINISSTLLSALVNAIIIFLFLQAFSLNNGKEKLIEIGFGMVGGGSGGGGTDKLNLSASSVENNISPDNNKEVINKNKISEKENLKSQTIKNNSSEETISSKKESEANKKNLPSGSEQSSKGKGGSGTNPEGTGIGNGYGPGSGNGNGSGNGEGNGVGDGYSIDFGGRVRKIYSYIIPDYPSGVSINIDIKLKFTILPDGTVGTIFPLIKANAQLESTAINSLRQWRFEPIPIEQRQQVQTVVITFPFRIK